MSLLLKDSRKSSPLLGGRINTSGVVGTSVQQNSRTILSLSQILNKTIKVQSNVLAIIVSVRNRGHTSSLENGTMVGPSRGRQVNVLRGEELGQEFSTNSQSTSTRNGLGGGNPLLKQSRRISTISKLSSSNGKVGNTSNTSVLLVQVLLSNARLSFKNRGQHKGLASIVTVSTNTEVNLLFKSVLLKGLSNTENGIGRSLLDIGPGGLVSNAKSKSGSSKSNARRGESSDIGAESGSSNGTNHCDKMVCL